MDILTPMQRGHLDRARRARRTKEVRVGPHTRTVFTKNLDPEDRALARWESIEKTLRLLKAGPSSYASGDLQSTARRCLTALQKEILRTPHVHPAEA